MYRNLNDYEIVYMVKDNDYEFEILYRKYLPLLYKIANRYSKLFKKYNIEKEDLVQILSISLIKAINNYNESNSSFYIYLNSILHNDIKNELDKLFNNHNKIIIATYNDNNNYYLTNYIDEKVDIENDIIIREYYMLFKSNLDLIESSILDLKIEGFSALEISQLLDIDYKYCLNKIYYYKKEILYI